MFAYGNIWGKLADANRRRFLGVVGAGVVGTTSGCLGEVRSIAETEPTFDHPESVRIDERFSLEISGLPSGEVEVTATADDDNDVTWSTTATYEATDGTIDLEADVPVDGTDDDAGTMQLIQSMETVDGEGSTYTPPPEETLSLEVSAGDDVLGASTMTRTFGDPELTVTELDGGPAGVAFEPPGSDPVPAVVVLHASEAEPLTDYARMLASNGFVALALHYYGAEGSRTNSSRFPSNSSTKPRRGCSITTGSRTLRWDCSDGRGWRTRVVGRESVRFGRPRRQSQRERVVVTGLSPGHATEHAWTLDGEPIPHFTGDDEREEAAIAVEENDGPVLLVSGGEDLLWSRLNSPPSPKTVSRNATSPTSTITWSSTMPATQSGIRTCRRGTERTSNWVVRPPDTRRPMGPTGLGHSRRFDRSSPRCGVHRYAGGEAVDQYADRIAGGNSSRAWRDHAHTRAVCWFWRKRYQILSRSERRCRIFARALLCRPLETGEVIAGGTDHHREGQRRETNRRHSERRELRLESGERGQRLRVGWETLRGAVGTRRRCRLPVGVLRLARRRTGRVDRRGDRKDRHEREHRRDASYPRAQGDPRDDRDRLRPRGRTHRQGGIRDRSRRQRGRSNPPRSLLVDHRKRGPERLRPARRPRLRPRCRGRGTPDHRPHLGCGAHPIPRCRPASSATTSSPSAGYSRRRSS